MPLPGGFSPGDRKRIGKSVILSEREQHGPNLGPGGVDRPFSNYDYVLKGVLDGGLVAGSWAYVSIKVPTIVGSTITWAEDDDWTETVWSDPVSDYETIPAGTNVTIGYIAHYASHGAAVFFLINAEC